MEFKFNCFGHENVLALHRNTIEFSKDSFLTKDGDCIIGVKADFDFFKLMNFILKIDGKIADAEIFCDGVSDKFSFVVNPDFSDAHEIVIRRTEFRSRRTLGVNADKAAKDIKREFIDRIKNSKAEIKVIFRA